MLKNKRQLKKFFRNRIFFTRI